jgi:hypothetical protein
MPALKHFAADASPEQIVAALDEDGACIVDALAPMDTVAAEIMPYIEVTPPGRDGFTSFHTTRTGALVARSPACRDLVAHATILGACDLFLKRACDRYRLHLTQAIRIRPGQEKQPLHRDRLAWGGYLQRSIEPQLNTIWAMTDFTEANGATQVVPGSNRWPEGRDAKPEEVGYAVMKRGSVLIYSGSVIHAGGANRADHDRIGLNITYALGWLRQEENQYLSCPPAIARTLDPKLQELIGYAMGGYALGYFSPPGPPGGGEICPPRVALGADADAEGAALGAAEMQNAIIEREREKRRNFAQA